MPEEIETLRGQIGRVKGKPEILNCISTSIVQSGLSLQVFPQALTINGFTGAVMGATLGPAIIGELLRHTMAKNAALLSTNISNTNPEVAFAPIGQLYGLVQTQALVVSMKEIYGWLLIIALASLTIILLTYSSVRPFAIFPKWSTIRRTLKHLTKQKSKIPTP